jgi:hypothetical protein
MLAPAAHTVSWSRSDPALLVGLGLLVPRLASALADALLKAQDGTRHVDVSLSNGAKLTAPETGNHCEPNQGCASPGLSTPR